MNNTIKILLFIISISFCYPLYAQQKGVKKAGVKQNDTLLSKTKIKYFLPDVYLGSSSYFGGNIKKTLFDSLIKKGLTSHDSLGNVYKIIGFDFAYAERNLYEDSMANLVVMVDYSTEYCPGDTISQGISKSLYHRTKPGDTVFIEKIKVVKLLKPTMDYTPDSNAIRGKSLKFVIVK